MAYNIEEIYPGTSVDHLVKLLYSQHAMTSLRENAMGTVLEPQLNRIYFPRNLKSMT